MVYLLQSLTPNMSQKNLIRISLETACIVCAQLQIFDNLTVHWFWNELYFKYFSFFTHINQDYFLRWCRVTNFTQWQKYDASSTSLIFCGNACIIFACHFYKNITKKLREMQACWLVMIRTIKIMSRKFCAKNVIW